MASICYSSISVLFPPNSSNPNKPFPFPPKLPYPNPFPSLRTSKIRAANSSSVQEEHYMSIDNLHRFVDLNMGKWTGSFHQFDGNGNLLQKINTRLSASSYGEDELISLIQTLYIQQPQSSTSVSGHDEEPEWAEYKIKETNMFTVDKYQQVQVRILPFLGKWEGHSVTKRSGVYGSTITEADTVALLQMDDKNKLVQDVTSMGGGRDVRTNVHWTGTISDNLVEFEGAYQLTLLPGGMYMGYPSDIAKSVAESKSFHLEFCWLEAPGKRQRLVRTYDAEGLAVSSTYFSEVTI
ncbi:Domain of Uncharacterized protein function isoform 3 [Theobroma cacao]|uniref:Domain of Uncharacterized protein function isoform 3 n=1 Tax=Theobroma cacao TaxID=3641 RepID=A0A061EGN5_THECC|nr:Domain of Uncharacterized protein function isoform 3 [Theobroma cacao]